MSWFQQWEAYGNECEQRLICRICHDVFTYKEVGTVYKPIKIDRNHPHAKRMEHELWPA